MIQDFVSNTAVSADGTTISYRSIGTGPMLVVVPGNNRMAHHYDDLARRLSDAFCVATIDRRGRGQSGGQGSHYSIEREAEDVMAVMAATGASFLFGHSYGGLAALHAALIYPVEKLVVYDPGVSIKGSFPGSWLPDFEQALAAHKPAKAMTIFLKRTQLYPISRMPTPFLWILSRLLLSGDDGRETLSMMPNTVPEAREVLRLDSSGQRYQGITAETLLLGGTKTPDFLTGVLPVLKAWIPRSEYRILPELDHNAPDLNAPQIIADEIRSFFVV
jgi:pimeloyl-ACP methyl ester carboxylesterase